MTSHAAPLPVRRSRPHIKRTVMREQIKDVLLERILGGAYQPGDRLVEMQLAQELGTSQAPVREALRELEALGFVASQPFRGSRVRAVTRAELAEIYPVRAALEEVAAREAAVRLDGNVAALQTELDAMRLAARRDDLHAFLPHDVAFHRLIVEAAGNTVLLNVWTSLRVEARTLISAIETDLDLRDIAEMHRPVLDALAARDPEQAGTLLRRHIAYFGKLILEGERR